MIRSTFSCFFLCLLLNHLAVAQSYPLAIEEMRKSIEKDTGSKFDTEKVLKRFEKIVDKSDSNDGQLPDKSKTAKLKKLSVGEQRVAAMLAANRAKLKAQQKARGAVSASKKKSWIEQRSSQQNSWVDDSTQAQKKWRESRARSLKRWASDRNRFKKELPQYKAALTVIPVKELIAQPLKKSIKKKPRYKEIEERSVEKAQLHFISANFKQSIRDQGPRPTCAAFAAVRAVEIKARAMGKAKDLSEQYFYFASKPECQETPCSKPGSWPRRAFLSSQQSVYPDIPLERNCPYKSIKKKGNDTQIPLVASCRRGVAKIERFTKVQDLSSIQDKIRQGHPVVGGFKLSKNFYLNKGYVFKNKGMKLGSDSHAQGHALLLVGVMELPKNLHSSQGRFCTIVANSWGEGWGKGGYACLSDSWFEQFRYNIPFLAVEKVMVN